MTVKIDDRIVFEAADVTVRIDCKKCRASFGVQPSELDRVIDRCPNCQVSWFSTEHIREPVVQLLAALRAMKARLDEQRAEQTGKMYAVSLEIIMPATPK